MIKRCLIIDNEDLSADIERIISQGKKKGIEIECEQFNVGSTFEESLLVDGKIVISQVVSEYRKRFKSKVFHLAAFDWDLSDDGVNGVELIRQFAHTKILRNTPKLLYTGLLEERLSSMLNDFRYKRITKEKLLAHVKTLITADIINFVGREKYEETILQHLETGNDQIDLIIEEELLKFPDLKFNNSFPSKSFNGKTFLEIAKILDENDMLRNEFKKELIQLVIADLTEIF